MTTTSSIRAGFRSAGSSASNLDAVLLAFDTATQLVSVALHDGERVAHRLLKTTRSYALEKLIESGEFELLRTIESDRARPCGGLDSSPGERPYCGHHHPERWRASVGGRLVFGP